MMRRTASAAPALRLAAVRACSSSSAAAAAATPAAAAAPAAPAGRSVLATLYQGGVKESELYPYPSFAATADAPVVAADSDSATVVRRAAEAGAFGSALAEAPQRTWAFEQLGEAGLSQVTSAFYHASVCAALQHSGTEAQKAGPLKKLEAGEAVAAYCLTEKSAGSDASAVETTATLSADGESYVLNGTKTWVTNGTSADYYLVFASLNKKLAAFLVERSDSIETAPVAKLGLDACDVVEVRLNNVRVPKDALVDAKGYALSLAVNSTCQLSAAAGLLGSQKKLLSNVIAHAADRKAFGRMLRDIPLVKQRIAQVTMRVYALESLLYRVAGLAAAGPSRKADASMESALTKVFAGEAAAENLRAAMGIMGAEGYRKGWLEVLVRDVHAVRNMGGTDEINVLLSALGGCELGATHLRAKSTTAVMFGRMKKTVGMGGPATSGAHASLGPASQTLDGLVGEFGSIVEHVVIKFGKKIADQQILVRKLGEAATQLYTMAVVVARASAAAEAGEEGHHHETLMATTWCRDTAPSVQNTLADLKNVYQTTDTNIGRIADTVCIANGYVPKHPVTVTPKTTSA